ncbi:erythroferrone isoform X2 [Syngnathoides biaculeatus]|uniref:erythroferrone isoform X2 n=1 Tax=Syngnathoides biaculeatus TaxID=300417 RepID=UPI002ADD3BDD|nr:erythroferrone isoform X2 [Syngnathoides biaculeatus]
MTPIRGVGDKKKDGKFAFVMTASAGGGERSHLALDDMKRPDGVRCPPMMTTMATMAMMMMAVMAASSGREDRHDGVVQDSTPSDGSPLSPRTSWMTFTKNSQAQSKNSRRTAKAAPRGPPVPPLTPGSRRRPQRVLDDVGGGLAAPSLQLIRSCRSTAGPCASSPPGGVSRCPPRVPASFVGLLRRAVEVARRSLVELRPFTQARGYRRGGFDVSDGRYAATLSGFYLFTARLRLQSGERVHVGLGESVKAAICIESLCRSKLSIETVVGVASVGGAFSMTLSGTLFLQAGEYASVYVDNATGARVSVAADSFFSATPLAV